MKRISALLLALVMVISMAGCGEKPQETPKVDPGKDQAQTGQQREQEPKAEEPEAVLGAEPVEITFWHCASDNAGALIDKYVEEYNRTNDKKVTVKAVYQGQYSDATTLLKTVLSAENYGQLPDIMQMDATGKVDYYNSGRAFTIDDAVAAFGEDIRGEYAEAALCNWQFSGKQLGLPFATSTTVTYYNADMLKKAGWDHCPDTFADVIRLAGDMKAAGIDAAALGTIPNTPTLANWIGQLGSFVVNNSNGSEGTASEISCLDNGKLQEFLSEWKAMYDSGALVNEALSTSEFVAQDVALYTYSSSSLSSVIEKVGGAFEVGVSPYLRVNDDASFGATVSGSCLAMFGGEDSLRLQAAWDFMKYMTGEQIQADYAANTGYIPAFKAAAENPVYTELLARMPQYSVGPDQLSKTPSEMRSVTVGPSTDFYYAIMDGCSEMLADGESPDEAAKELAESLQDLLDAYIRNNQ